MDSPKSDSKPNPDFNTPPVIIPFGEGTSGTAGCDDDTASGSNVDRPLLNGGGEPVSPPLVRAGLNPFAREWHPSIERQINVDSRCLYITFSKGYPLSDSQIITFFNMWFGAPVVESVYLHWPQPRPGTVFWRREEQLPRFGRVTFQAVYMPMLILQGNEEIEFLIYGRTVRFKRFLRRI